MTQQLADIGLIGLAVMGENLALNMESKGFRVAVYNRTASRMEEFVAGREERSTTPDGGPLACRVVHRAKVWKGGETPQLERTRLKGKTPLSI
jgi:6-phosphogluconate dehydrogenase (decarboxylating)